MNDIFFGEFAVFVREEFHRANINGEFFTLAHCDYQRHLSKMRKRTIAWNRTLLKYPFAKEFEFDRNVWRSKLFV